MKLDHELYRRARIEVRREGPGRFRASLIRPGDDGQWETVLGFRDNCAMTCVASGESAEEAVAKLRAYMGTLMSTWAGDYEEEEQV